MNKYFHKRNFYLNCSNNRLDDVSILEFGNGARDLLRLELL